jgi:hypothetical protein
LCQVGARETTAAPAKVKVPKVTDLNRLTSSDWRGIVATVDERIEWRQFETLVTKNFSSLSIQALPGSHAILTHMRTFADYRHDIDI